MTRPLFPAPEGPAVVLKPGRDKAVHNRHHWIFSGAVESYPEFEDGDVLPVRSAAGELLGFGYFNSRTSIAGRMLSFGGEPPAEAVAARIDEAVGLRRRLVAPGTDAYRVINAEGDGLPGLIADLYAGVLVVQISTLGMETLRDFVLGRLEERLGPRLVYERSGLPARREEGLGSREGPLRGDRPEPVEITESGLRFLVDVAGGQKTGFYLDQREARALVRTLAAGRRVLDVFCYTGGFTVAALAGGAASARGLDASERALETARLNLARNGFGPESARFEAADAMEALRGGTAGEDFVILDPPAFAKRREEVVTACRGYKDLHRPVFKSVPKEALVLTFSCSHFVDETLFRQVLFQAAAEAGRSVRILQHHRQALDHPVNIFHPETGYLKGFLLAVD